MDDRTRGAERLLEESLSSDLCIIESAAAELEKLSACYGFPRCLLTIISGGESQLVRESAAIYLKNLVLRLFDKCSYPMEIDRDFLKEFMELLFVVDRRIFKFLLESFGQFFLNDFVRKKGWRDLFPQLESVIHNSSLMEPNANSRSNTVHAEVLAVICKTLMSQNSSSRRLAVETPFRSATEDLFYNTFPPIKDDGPPELELMAKTILLPLLTRNQEFIDKAFAVKDMVEMEFLQCIRVICKCMSCIMKSCFPLALCPILPKYSSELCRVLDSFEFDNPIFEGHNLLLLKITRRGLDFLFSMVNRKRNLIESYVPNIQVSAENIASQSVDIAMLDPLRMRILHLAFDLLGYLKSV